MSKLKWILHFEIKRNITMRNKGKLKIETLVNLLGGTVGAGLGGTAGAGRQSGAFRYWLKEPFKATLS